MPHGWGFGPKASRGRRAGGPSERGLIQGRSVDSPPSLVPPPNQVRSCGGDPPAQATWVATAQMARPLSPPPSSPAAAAPIIAIAGSVGGPEALGRIACGVDADFAAPIVVVQHAAFGFVDRLAAWLREGSTIAVRVAEDGEPLRPATMYLAPDGAHLVVARGRVVLDAGPPRRGLRPSADALFASVAREAGGAAIAVLFSGIERDGLAGLAKIRDAGGFVLVEHDRDSPLFGTSAAALDAGLPDAVLPLAAIAPALASLVGRPHLHLEPSTG